MRQMRVLYALAALLIAAGAVSADTQWSQVAWFTASSVAHTISYGVYNSSIACSQTAIYYVEPAPIDGTETKINASTSSAGTYKCQNSTQSVIRVVNTGSVGINVSTQFNQITSGVTVKLGRNNTAWQTTCNGICNGTICILNQTCLALSTSPVWVAYNIPQNSSRSFWIWADFLNVAGTSSPTKGNLTTTAVKYA